MDPNKRTAKTAVLWALGLLLAGSAEAGLSRFSPAARAERVPVILNTDIGDDIDDTWALVMLLKSPQLDLRLVTTTYGKAIYRARLICRILAVAGRTDVPVGLGAGGTEGTGGQEPWVDQYKLESYPGKIYKDGTQALIDMVDGSSSPVTIVSIGPSTTVAAALEKRPEIARRAFFVGMQGSVRRGYGGGPVGPEYNVKENVPAAKKVLLAPWLKATITPLDTCGLVRLTGEHFRKLAENDDALVRALLENYRIWAKKESVRELTESSVLFDTVAIYLALPGDAPLLRMEELRIDVAAGGLTVIDPAGAKMSVATAWNDLDRYEDFLVSVLLTTTK
jgi:inosine-uridine nucleoside N-ribohydrolase